MRFFVMAFLVCALTGTEVLAIQDPPELQKLNSMKGVKTRVECEFDVDTDARPREETLATKRTAEYNDRGDMARVTISHRDATFVDTYAYENDAKGRKERCVWTTLSGRLKEKSTFTYQADGACVKSVIVTSSADGPEKAICASTYEYNAKGQLTSEAHNLVNGFKVPRKVYVYDEKSRLTERKAFVDSSPFPEVTSYIYEDATRIVIETTKDDEGVVLEKVVRHLNERGDAVLICYAGKDDKEKDSVEVRYVYDASGRVLIRTEEKRREGSVIRAKRYTYQYEFYEKK